MTNILSSFTWMIFGALFGAALGSAFGAGLGYLTPDLVTDLFQLKGPDPIRYAAGVGAIVGLFLGFGGMILALGIQALGSQALGPQGPARTMKDA